MRQFFCIVAILFAGASALSVTNSKFSLRYLDMGDTQLDLAVFEVMFDAPVSVKMNSTTYIPFSNMRGSIILPGGDSIPRILRNGGFAKLRCTQGSSQVFQSYGSAGGGPPMFLMPSPPSKEPQVSVLAAFGGYALPETWENNKAAFTLILGGATDKGAFVNIDKNTILACKPQLVFPGDVDATYNPAGRVLVDESTLTAFTGTVDFDKPAPPKCTVAGVQDVSYTFDLYRSLLANVSDLETLKSLQFLESSFTIREAWTGCVDTIKQWLRFVTETMSLTNDGDCRAAPGTPQFATSPCCNQTLAYTQCCARGVGTYQYQFQRLDSTNPIANLSVVNQCMNPDKVRAMVSDFALSLQIAEEKARSKLDLNSAFREYGQWIQDCRTDIYFSKCSLDTQCIYSGSCNTRQSQCEVDWSNQFLPWARCLLRKAPADLIGEMLRMWQIPRSVNTTTTELEPLIATRLRADAKSVDCVGMRADAFREKWTSVKDPETGNYMGIVTPANTTGCLLEKACNWRNWDSSYNAICNDPQVTDIRGQYFCAIDRGAGYQEVSVPPRCVVSGFYDQSSCQAGGLYWSSDFYQCLNLTAKTLSACYSSPLCSASRTRMQSALDAGTFNFQQDSWRVTDPSCSSTVCYNPSLTNTQCNQLAQSAYSESNSDRQRMLWGVNFDSNINMCVRYMWDDQNANCALLGADWGRSQGRIYSPGQWATQAECESVGMCTVPRLSYFGVNATVCTSAMTCDQPCSRCATWMRNSDNTEKTVCYYPGPSNSTHCNQLSGSWTSNHGSTPACVLVANTPSECAAKSGLWSQCDQLTQQQCNSDSPAFNWGHADIGCQWQPQVECRSEDECRAAAQCEDWEFNECSWSGSAMQCKEGFCVLPSSTDYMGRPSRDCPQGGGGKYRMARVGCIDTSITTQAACQAKPGATWQLRGVDAATCAAHGSQCFTPGYWDNYAGRNQQQCAQCGGAIQNIYAWRAGNPERGKMQQLVWVQRQVQPVNKVIETLSDRMLQQIVYDAISRVVSRQIANSVNAKYALILPVINTLACDCFEKRTGCFSGPLIAQDASCTVDPSTTATCSGAQGSITTTPSNFPPNTPPTTITTTTSLTSGVVTSSPSSPSSTTPVSSPSYFTKSFSLMAVGNSATYAVVKNSYGAVIGQLVGNGYTPSSGATLVYPVQICVSTSTSIDQDATTYPTVDFAIANADGSVGLPQGLSVTVSGLSYCANVQSAGTYFPIRRVTDWSNVRPATPSSSSSSSTGTSQGTGQVFSSASSVAVSFTFFVAVLLATFLF